MAQQYTRKKIREVFVEMLNERPLKEITVKDIVAACEINRNTFYYYYPDIYGVLGEIFEIELQSVVEKYNDTLSWEEGFLKAADFALQNKRAVYHIYHSMQKEVLAKYIFRTAGNVMTRYVEKMNQDIHGAGEDVKLIAFFYQSALTEMVLWWIEKGMKEDPAYIVRRIGKLFDGNIQLSLERSAGFKDKW